MAKKHFFGELEQAIMDVTWEHGPVTVREVLLVIARQRTVAYTTVMTVMNRLQEQGFLRRQMGSDGAYRYRSASTRQALYAAAARRQAQELVHHYGDAALVQFLDTLDQIPNEKLSKLKRQMKRRTR